MRDFAKNRTSCQVRGADLQKTTATACYIHGRARTVRQYGIEPVLMVVVVVVVLIAK